MLTWISAKGWAGSLKNFYLLWQLENKCVHVYTTWHTAVRQWSWDLTCIIHKFTFLKLDSCAGRVWSQEQAETVHKNIHVQGADGVSLLITHRHFFQLLNPFFFFCFPTFAQQKQVDCSQVVLMWPWRIRVVFNWLSLIASGVAVTNWALWSNTCCSLPPLLNPHPATCFHLLNPCRAPGLRRRLRKLVLWVWD